MKRLERFDPPDLGTVSPELTAEDTASLQRLHDHLERCAFEYLARVNDDPQWKVHPHAHGESDTPVWEVDEAATEGAIILARQADGLRVEVDVSVFVGAQRTARRGVMPDDGWPQVAPA